MSSTPTAAPHSRTSPGIVAADVLASLALGLADLAAANGSLRSALILTGAALGAARVELRAAGEATTVTAAGAGGAADTDPPVACTLEAEVSAGGRELGILTCSFGAGVAPAAPLPDVARLLAPLLAMREGRANAGPRAGPADAGGDALAAQEHFVAMIVDLLPVGLYVVDREYRVRLWNRGREVGLQGVARADVLGRSIFDVLHRQPAERLRQELDAIFATGEALRFEVESSAFGESRSYRLSRIPMRLHGDEVTHVIAIGEDITNWKQAQLRSMRAEKLAAVGQLAAGVMHEVNNPLATIAACAETLRAEVAEDATPSPATMRELLGIIEHEVHRCRRLADDLLGFSRQSPAERVPVDAVQLVDETFTLLAHHSRFRRARVRHERPGSPLAAVLADREQLMQVLMALLLNAVDAVAGGGEVRVGTRAAEGEVLIDVSDTGRGIPPEDLPRIFEPFFTTKPVGQGTGLGLAISYGIVADHGGRLDVHSVPGEGSTFTIALPVWEE